MTTLPSSAPPRILIAGAGAVGLYYGSRLQQAGCSVAFLMRGKRLDHFRRKPLEVLSYLGDFQEDITPVSQQELNTLEKRDLIVACCKCYDLDTLCEELRPAVKEGTSLLSLLNGVESERTLASCFPGTDIIGGISFIAAEVQEDYTVNHTASGHLTIGGIPDISHPDKRHVSLETLKKLFEKAHVNCNISERIEKDFWGKMIWNTGYNALCAVTGKSGKEVLANPETRNIVQGLMKECIAVAEGLGYTFNPEKAIERNISVTEKAKGDIIPSMLQDRKNRKPLEIDAINGVVVKEGKRLGIATPYNDTLTALLHLL